jgi:hypothetical protein
MTERMFRKAEAGHARGRRSAFDPVAEGSRYRLEAAVAVAIWERVCREATGPDGFVDDEQAQCRFHVVAALVALRGGQLEGDPGRVTRQAMEERGDVGDDVFAPRTPGKTTEVERWARRLDADTRRRTGVR